MRTKRTRAHRLFNKFLRENKCKRKFYRNEKKSRLLGDFIVYRTEESYYFYCAFTWSKTPEGRDYWEKIAEKWNDYFYDNRVEKWTKTN